MCDLCGELLWESFLCVCKWRTWLEFAFLQHHHRYTPQSVSLQQNIKSIRNSKKFPFKQLHWDGNEKKIRISNLNSVALNATYLQFANLMNTTRQKVKFFKRIRFSIISVEWQRQRIQCYDHSGNMRILFPYTFYVYCIDWLRRSVN